MNDNDFRRLVMDLPEVIEAAHMGHPDFRVRGKIFATLSWRDDECLGMVKLTPEQQGEFVKAKPKVFSPVPGGWGRRGCTYVRLASATKKSLFPAIMAAWENVAGER